MAQKIEIAKEIILPIYEKTLSVNATARELGISWGVAKRILEEYGVTPQKGNQYGKFQQYNLFKSIETEADAYWLGIMYTDGWVRSDRNEIGLGSIDKDLIEKFKTYTGSTNSISVKKAENLVGKSAPNDRTIQTARDFYQFTFSSKVTKENLELLGCIPKKSKRLTCPTEEQVPQKLIYHFLRGVIDGDGWVRWNEAQSKYDIGFLGGANFITELTTRARISHYGKMRKKQDSDIYEFAIYKKDIVKKVLDLVYGDSTIHLDRKYATYKLSQGA